MKKPDLALGAYQMAGGLFSAFSLFTPMAQRHWSSVLFLLLFAALSITAGALHFLKHPKRYQLTIANHVTQTLGIYTPWMAIVVMQGAWVKVAFLFDQQESFAKSLWTITAAGGFPESTCDVDLFGSLPDLHTFGVSVNFLAVAILIYAIVQRKKTACSDL